LQQPLRFLSPVNNDKIAATDVVVVQPQVLLELLAAILVQAKQHCCRIFQDHGCKRFRRFDC
jgi:CBS-domain-containing membrane protein